jgi:hypothetical protein
MWQTHNIQSGDFYETSFVSNRQKSGPVKLDLSGDSSQCLQTPFCFRQISLVDFEPNKSFHAAALRGHSRISDA